MSEQEKPVSFMEKLDAWSDTNVILPLITEQSEEDSFEVIEGVKKAIKAKVLESYRNGVAVGARQAGEGERREFSRNSGPRNPLREAASQGHNMRQRRPVFQR